MRGGGRGPGIAKQLRELMRSHGYWLDAQDRPAANRFAGEKGYDLILVLHWLKGKQPSWENVFRLARDFDVTPAELLFGKDGGRELVRVSMSMPPAKKSAPRRRRSRAAKALGAIALLGASLCPSTLTELQVTNCRLSAVREKRH